MGSGCVHSSCCERQYRFDDSRHDAELRAILPAVAATKTAIGRSTCKALWLRFELVDGRLDGVIHVITTA